MSVGKASIQRVSGAKKAPEAVNEEKVVAVVTETKPAAKKAEAPKASAKKTAAPKAAAKKPAAKKPAAKKPAAKKPAEKAPVVETPAVEIEKKEEAKIPAIRLNEELPYYLL